MDKDLVKELNDLAQVDVDAYHAYAQAIEAIKNTEIKEKLMSFQHDHVKHIENLAETVKQLGRQPIEFSRDFKGFIITGYTDSRAQFDRRCGCFKSHGNKRKHYKYPV